MKGTNKKFKEKTQMASKYETVLKLGARETEGEVRHHFPACLSAGANGKAAVRGQGGRMVGWVPRGLWSKGKVN